MRYQELCRAGRNDLAQKVDWVSQRSDAFGYDIHSFTLDGSDKLIEVKTTRMPLTPNPSFMVSAKEYEVLETEKPVLHLLGLYDENGPMRRCLYSRPIWFGSGKIFDYTQIIRC